MRSIIKYVSIPMGLFILVVVYLADRGTMPVFLARLYTFPYGDKAGHFILSGLLALTANLTFACRRVTIRSFRLMAGSLAVAALAGVEEMTQLLFTTRTFSLVDLAAGLFGIALIGSLARLMPCEDHHGQ